MTHAFDPDAAAQHDGIFGLPTDRGNARIIVIPAPFDATTSYRPGTANGPDAILHASRQVDLLDHLFGNIYERGIFMEEPDPEIAAASNRARALAGPILERGGASPEDARAVGRINAECENANGRLYSRAKLALSEGRTPIMLGGEHAMSLGPIRACAEAFPGLAILQVDAHMDLREAFEGFRYSHASIMWNVLREAPGVSRLVQVGIRDYSGGESEAARSSAGRVRTHFDQDWWARQDRGESFASLARCAIDDLGPSVPVYVSLDIDGLDPSLCPHTGTPVAGGLSFSQASALLKALADSGRRVVGADLVEVAPSHDPGAPEWDANVGARVLYKLCGVCGGR